MNKLFNKMPFMALLLAMFMAGCGSDGDTGAPGATGPAGNPDLGTSPVVPVLGTASGFTLLSFGTSTPALTVTGTATTTSPITGNVGSSGAVTLTDAIIVGNLNHGGALASTTSSVSGTITPSLSAQVTTDFNAAYAALEALACDQTLTTGDFTGVALLPGVYCVVAGSTTTGGTLTLIGGSTSKWVFKIGTGGTGALTFTDSTVSVANGCNVTWWVKQAATVTRGAVKGNIHAGTAIDLTGTAATPETFAGRALAKTGLTSTDMKVTGCQ